MLAWSEGELIIGRQKTRNHGYDVIVGGEPLILLRSPRKLVTPNPKLKSTGRTLPASSRWWDAYRKQLGLKDFSEKSGRCGIAAD